MTRFPYYNHPLPPHVALALVKPDLSERELVHLTHKFFTALADDVKTYVDPVSTALGIITRGPEDRDGRKNRLRAARKSYLEGIERQLLPTGSSVEQFRFRLFDAFAYIQLIDEKSGESVEISSPFKDLARHTLVGAAKFMERDLAKAFGVIPSYEEALAYSTQTYEALDESEVFLTDDEGLGSDAELPSEIIEDDGPIEELDLSERNPDSQVFEVKKDETQISEAFQNLRSLRQNSESVEEFALSFLGLPEVLSNSFFELIENLKVKYSHHALQALFEQGALRSDVQAEVNLLDSYESFLIAARDIYEYILDEEMGPIVFEGYGESFADLRRKIFTALHKRLLGSKEDKVLLEINMKQKVDCASFVEDIVSFYEKLISVNSGWQVQLIEQSDEILGRSRKVVLEVVGLGAYDFLEQENGEHKISYSDGQILKDRSGKPQTHYFTVDVSRYHNAEAVELNDRDLNVERFSGSTNGGQHAQKNATNVRLIHTPTGLSVTIRGRSLSQNENEARRILKAKLAAKQELERLARERMGRELLRKHREQVRFFNLVRGVVIDSSGRKTVKWHDVGSIGAVASDMAVYLVQAHQAEVLSQPGDASRNWN